MPKKITATPGPWRTREAFEFGSLSVVGKRNAHVANVWNGGTRLPEVAEANARLICAAPEMVRALQAILTADAEDINAIARKALALI